jgi:hypothetical protein
VEKVAMEVQLPKVSDRVCARFWGIDANDRLCAGYNLAQKGICDVSLFGLYLLLPLNRIMRVQTIELI